MPDQFFEKEVKKLRERFNQAFGDQTVCDLHARCSAILSICRAEILARKITQTKERVKTRDDIREFIWMRNVLHGFFKLVEKQNRERSDDINGSAGKRGSPIERSHAAG